MSEAGQSTGTLEAATGNAARLLEDDPSLAAEQALEILKAVPDHPPAVLILAAARRRAGDPQAALGVLGPLLRAHPLWPAVHYEHALSLSLAGRGDDAIRALRRTVELRPQHQEAWRVLADHLLAIGDTAGGDAAYARHVQASAKNPVLQQAASAMLANDVPAAERALKGHLHQFPTDVAAIRMLAEVAIRLDRLNDAAHLLERCIELAPSFVAARYNYAVLLHRRNDPSAALRETERLLAIDPRNPSYRNLLAVLLSRLGEYARSSATYAGLLEEYPGHAKVWMSYGHVLKTEGRTAECIEAYRRAIELEPALGEAYWSLANLKTFQFDESDLEAMRAQLARSDVGPDDRAQFHFALGKALEDRGEFAESFDHYSRGNARHRAGHPYDAELNSRRVQRMKEVFTREFFAQRAGAGCPSPDPIFIVGMPRAGSTLLEQILASHSQVEGTMELPEMISLAKGLRSESGAPEIAAYVEVLGTKSPAELRELGELYLERTRIYRKTDRPFFIDKMPNNFLHVGLIHLILPDAKIIDARRHPLGCCVSNFKQYYARGQNFSYGLADMGRYYRDYVELMAHFDEVLPGRVHRVIYERTVEDTEVEVRRLLDYCGLPFEEACLRFFENQRPVRTASAEQVRRPIYQQGVDQWRQYDTWLGPLKEALGPVLEAYPDAPRN